MRTLYLLKSLFLLAVLSMGVCSASAQTTYHLEKVTSVEAGGLYVFEQSGHVMNNTISSNALLAATNYKMVALTGTESYVWTLVATNTEGAYYMKNVSKGTYLANVTKGSTNVSLSSSGSKWAFNFQDNETALIQNKDNEDRCIGFDFNQNFRAYTTSTNTPHDITVYQLVEDPTTVTVTVGAKGFATLASDYALDFTGMSIKAYTITSTDGSTLTLTQKDLVAKDEPVLLYSSTANDSQDIPIIAEATADTNNKLVKGTGATITWSDTEKVYILYTGDENPGFYRANNSVVATNKAYLDLTTLNVNARSFTLNLDEETTGVGDVRGKMEDVRGEVFDLQGRRVAQPTRGLYIINGKTVIINTK